MIVKMLKAGYLSFTNLSGSVFELKMGTPQGSIISLLLLNIYLNELDEMSIKFMDKF